MTLTSAFNITRSILTNAAAQSAVVSTNIANASNPDYVRRVGTTSVSETGASITGVARIRDDPLLKRLLSGISVSSGQSSLYSGILSLRSILGGNDYGTSPSTYLGKLNTTLQLYRTSPSSSIAAQSVVNAASDVALSLRSASNAVQTLRTEADRDIAVGVDKLNGLLREFKITNDAVKAATTGGSDAGDALDQRDSLLKQLSTFLGIKSVTRESGDMVLSTQDGTVLFETIPRTVTFEPTPSYAPDVVGNAVYIDGVQLSASGANPVGRLSASLHLRDDLSVTFQAQVDEIARALVTNFAETSGADGTQAAGLFVWNGSGVPAAPTLVTGMAATIAVNPAVVVSSGGDPSLLRDGGINGVAFVVNTSEEGGFTARLDAYLSGLSRGIAFDPAAGIGGGGSLLDYASLSVGWLEEQRSTSASAADAADSIFARAAESYSNATGVNLDEELLSLMAIEQSYKAGTKLLMVINEMIKSLIEAA
ncbi:flagellar hook-associated protein FlgK [Rhizobium ruizarguesonis]|uniref:flagellar hook-associated protein FlgK n=1 Tax=Rhizobium ruizarguesonis TaxID=2081791 RepID=UPI0013C19C0F|nr:flagellar hook-associated protein FlgK [Rhizobium ruizarguesonis]NEJ02638.1 flagellar hook-associated protein FlgK [Rhizobium ruizarguesonis]NEJ39765.1 flagellar hook-associated protein FlgK [Rhizobium ruizarguesonis]